MSDTLETIIVVSVAALLFGGVLFFIVKRALKRAKDIMAFAERHGLEYRDVQDPDEIRLRYQTLKLFAPGDRHLFQEAVGGNKDGIEICIGDYEYWNVSTIRRRGESYQSKVGTSTDNTVFIATIPDMTLPAFDISLRQKGVNFSLYADDIEITGTDLFLAAYKVRCERTASVETIGVLLTNAVQDAIAAHKTLRIECHGAHILIHRPNWNIKAEEYDALYELLLLLSHNFKQKAIS